MTGKKEYTSLSVNKTDRDILDSFGVDHGGLSPSASLALILAQPDIYMRWHAGQHENDKTNTSVVTG